MANTIRLSGSPVRHLISLHTVARVVSDTLNPAIVGIPFLIVGVVISEVSGAYRFATLYFLIAVPPPLCYVLWLVAKGRVTDLHLSERHQRAGPFIVSLCSALCGLLVLFILDTPTVLFVALFFAFVQTVLLFVITLAWKISIHTAAIAGLITFALMALGSTALPSIPLVPLVAWARIYLGRHTFMQTVAGGVVGYVTFAMMYSLHGIAW